MPIWLIALAIAGGGYYLYSRNSHGNRSVFISENEYVDAKGVHWLITRNSTNAAYQFKTAGYGGDSGVDGLDRAAVVSSVEAFAASHTPV